MDPNPKQRVIVGESERCGQPISAPIGELSRPQVMPGALRWRHTGSYFVLEQYGRSGCCGYAWYEVPCMMDNANTPEQNPS